MQSLKHKEYFKIIKHRESRPGSSRFLYFVLTIVTAAMGLAALLQLIYVRRIPNIDSFSNWTNDQEARLLRLGLIKPEIISWSPRIIRLRNFLSSEECDYLRAVAEPRMEKSTVVDTMTGQGFESKFRTSTGMFLSNHDRRYPMIQAIEKRIAMYSMIPVENGELIQVLRYELDQYYKPHHDYFTDEFNIKRGGQRVATMLMYLNTVEEGGETIFPWVGDGECSCGGEMKKGTCVKPDKGDAILFWSSGLDGNLESKSMHGGCSVKRGEKWSATKWLRQHRFD